MWDFGVAFFQDNRCFLADRLSNIEDFAVKQRENGMGFIAALLVERVNSENKFGNSHGRIQGLASFG